MRKNHNSTMSDPLLELEISWEKVTFGVAAKRKLEEFYVYDLKKCGSTVVHSVVTELQCCQVDRFIHILRIFEVNTELQMDAGSYSNFYGFLCNMVLEEALPLQCCQVYSVFHGLSWTTEGYQQH